LLERSGTLAELNGIKITDSDFALLQPGRWLNRTIIDFYGRLIASPNECWSVDCFSADFYSKLAVNGGHYTVEGQATNVLYSNSSHLFS
jgi:Ulp1 family protease